MMSEFIEDDAIPASQRPCEVCGESQFYSEAGFYFCSTCNTQSQSHRVYVDEDFIPERQLQTRAAVLRDPKQTKKAAAVKDGKYCASTWEVWNVMLKHIADRLVEIGFPEIIRNKILHLYIAFMMQRRVIFVSKTNPAAKSAITLGENKTNIRSLYGTDVMPFEKRRYKRKRRKGPARCDDEEGGNIHGKLTPEELATRAQRKRKFAITRRKAIEQEYMLSEEAKQTQEEAEFEKGVTAEPGTSRESTADKDKDKPRKYVAFSYTRASRIIKNKYLKKVNIRRHISVLSSKNKRRKGNLKKEYVTKYRNACQFLRFERFTAKTCVILVFVALRQLGFPIVFTDLLRLLRCGFFRFENFLDIMKGYEEYKNIRYIWRLSIKCHIYARDITKDIDIFNHYLGIKKFSYPRMKEVVPKYIDDFVLPREFECLVNLFNHMFSFDDLVAAKKDIENYRHVPELLVMCQIVVVLKILFGLDDLTEKYQSEFARLVNKVIKDEAKAAGHPMEDWTELFVIEDWFGYIQRRRDLVKRELYSHYMFTPNRPPTLTKLNDLMEQSCKINDNDDPENMTKHQTNASHCIDTFKSILKDPLSPANESGQFSSFPQIKPYVPLPLPTQSVVNQYHERYPLVADPSFKPELFVADFVKKRIDFIWNPKKYTKLLELCGYKVKVIRGDAVNNFPTNLKEGTVLVFQPYKSFDEFIDGFREGCSDSLKLLFGVCEDVVHVLSAERLQFKHAPDRLFFPTFTKALGEMYIAKVLLGHVPVLTRWDMEFSND